MSGQSSASTGQELLYLEACADTSEPRSPPNSRAAGEQYPTARKCHAIAVPPSQADETQHLLGLHAHAHAHARLLALTHRPNPVPAPSQPESLGG